MFFIMEEMTNPELLRPFNEHFEIQSPLVGMSTNRSAEVSLHQIQLSE